ncbi:FecR family protein [Paraburkholderia sp.]|uniref:FecR family protein n=1 Tax=Paraburkholderia sp. TaxID=1926495 RepID=UPI003D6F80CF
MIATGSVERARRRRRALPFALSCIVATLSWLSVPAVAQKHVPRVAQATTPYVTRAGDTLYEIAARYLRDPGDWTVLSRLNHLPPPRRLPAGLQIRLPVALLKQERLSARVIATSGPVEHAFGNSPFTPVTTDMALGEGDRVRTGPNGFVTLELADGSHLSVPQNSQIDIGSLRQTVLTGANDRVIDLKHGEVDSEVTHATKKDDRFQIRSPSVVAGVRGTSFRVNYDRDVQSTAVEVLDGAVGVDSAATPPRAPGTPLQASSQLVNAHFGSVTHASGGVGQPVELLPAPALVDPGKIQDAKDISFDIAPSKDALGYRVQIARDADLLDMIRDQRATGPKASFDTLPDGTYFVRLSAIDPNGLQGLPQVYAFERRQLGLTATAAQRAGTRDFEFRWFVSRSGVPTKFRFVLAKSADLHDPVVDRTDLSSGRLVISELPKGVYYWTVIAEQFENDKFYEKGSSVRSFTLAR